MRLFAVAWLALFAVQAAEAETARPFVDCTTPAFRNDLMKDPGFACEEIRRDFVEIGERGVGLRTLRHKGDSASSASEPVAMDAARSALQSFGAYSTLKLPDNVSLVFVRSGQAGPPDLMAEARAKGSEECAVRIFPDAIKAEGDAIAELKTTLAHELFHCVQEATWPAQTAVDAARWWVEGSAELMGHVVFEAPGTLARRSADFATNARDIPITRGAYENVVFFAWLWNRKPSRLFSLIEAMPTSGGEAEQQAALVNAISAYDLDIFVTDYIDGKVRSPGGAALAPAKLDPAETVSGTTESAREVTPFTVFAADIDFANGQYMIAKDGAASASYKWLTDPGDWQALLLASAEGPCEARKTIRIAGMTTKPAPATLTLKITKLPGCETCTVRQVRDQCLVGLWKLDNEALADEVMANSDGGLERVAIDGHAALRNVANGKNLLGFAYFRLAGEAVGGNGILFGVDIAGEINSDWSAENNVFSMCYRSSDALMQIVGTGGSRGEAVSFSEMPMEKNFTARYTCTGDTLTLDYRVGDDQIALRFRRLQE